ncbi:glycosyl transferase sugar-binding region (DXD) protein [Metarhizium robertsii]|uniref:Glycosyltransferase family 32 protein n=2 Tax=Metarhizium robertsii TaxID=568076 RepID=E9FAL5_METRA|nr:glycosyltransferase family 32 protein [Metarhizium robertsii ARSEF 23]EFY95201.1 glycosyltransferase family 32 protein [Metarhizium robertsii ARSEF 23]EXU95233.1 glycosyl transferase sugar-binding region (DXD) protein [Metarhizium robertsii]
MIAPRLARRFQYKLAIISALAFCLIAWVLLAHKRPPRQSLDDEALRRGFPLVYKHIHSFRGKGGAWYIPPEWMKSDQTPPRTIIEAARIASQAAQSHPERHIPFSNIPLIVHQKWNTARLNGTDARIVSFVETWLTHSTLPEEGSSPMAYFLWDDQGVLSLVKELESPLADDFTNVFSPVEKVDIFRIMVCKWFGGIYGDIDTKPLQHPARWIQQSDIAEWTDELTGKTHGLDSAARRRLLQTPAQAAQPVNAIWGIECDSDPKTDAHWRMGYTYAIQLTNWALASAPRHPILQRFLDRLVDKASEAKQAALHTSTGGLSQLHYDPLTRTGPAAVTEVTRKWLEEREGLRWDALTGLKDNGKTKLAGDVLILPMTGFSPTRESYSRMGEKSWDHPDARLAHAALGSWHHTNLVVEYGKFCREVFGLCKDWQKMW